MEYRKEVTEHEDYTSTEEVYEGTPEEIIELMNSMPQEIDKRQWLTGESIEGMTMEAPIVNLHIEEGAEVAGLAKEINKLVKAQPLVKSTLV